MLGKVIGWSLENMEEYDINTPNEHGFVDLVRKKLNEENIEYEPLNYQKIKGYIEDIE